MTNQGEQSRSNVPLVILIVVIGIAFLLVASSSWLGLIRSTPFGHLIHFQPFAFSPILPLGLMSVIQIILAIWVGIDANRKGQNGILWALLVLFTSLIGLIVYLLISPMIASRSLSLPRIEPPVSATAQVLGAACPSCHAEVREDFRICPRCGATLARCRECDKSIRSDWKVCPYCGTAVPA